jgi:hypothetical protein
VEPFQQGKGGDRATRLPGMESARGWRTTMSFGIPSTVALCFGWRLKTEENVLPHRHFRKVDTISVWAQTWASPAGLLGQG